jgi:hypothetical protein
MVFGPSSKSLRRSGTPQEAALPPPTRRDLRRAARRTTVGKTLSRIAKFADMEAICGGGLISRMTPLNDEIPL